MDAVIAIAGKVADYTIEPVARQVGYLIFYKDNFKELTDHVTELQGARDGVKHLTEAEIRNGKEIETAVQEWLHRVDVLIEEANQLQGDPRHAKVGCSRWSFPNLMLRHQLSRKAKKMAKGAVEELGKRKFEQVAYLTPLDVIGSTSNTSGNEELVSRMPIKEGIGQALRDPKVSKIGVYGLGGVGKSTLVKEVAQKAKDDKLFAVVVWANVSQSPDLKRIQGEIADLLGLEFYEETVAGRARRLCERIKKAKTILIVLDDIWTMLDLEKVGIPKGGEHNGCKVLMTSRNEDILREMEPQKHFRLEALSEEETWSLFKVMAGDVDKDPSLQQIAYEVAKKCAGLPILIVTVARALQNRDIHIWKDALSKLARADNKELQEITYSALELSYNRLEGSEMKALFLLCAGISKQPWISDLLKYGMGLGIFKHVNTIEGARNRLHNMISALKASCLLLEDGTSTERLKMHDFVRDVAISIASRDQNIFIVKAGAELNEWPTKELLKRCPQIFLNWWDISELPERLDCPELKLFILNSSKRSLKIPDSFFESMESLRALDLSDLNIDSLPPSFHYLTNIRTLGLYRCTLGTMAAIGALKNLQILTIVDSSLKILPSEIGQLHHLILLDLSGSEIEFIPPHIISSLTKLEELYMGNTLINWEVEGSNKQNKNASLAEIRQLSNLTALELQIREALILPRDLNFEKLQRYKIVIGDVWEWYDIMHGTSKTLKLKLRTNIHLEHGIKDLIERVENLYLDEVDGIWNVLYQLNKEGFQLLKRLHIQNNAKIKHIIDSVQRNQAQVCFPNLETLTLYNLSNLEMICHGPVDVKSFGKLRVIKVQNCNQLKYLFSFSMVKGLSHLLKIEVCKCNFMKMIVFADSDASAESDITFSPLRSLTLQHLQTLDQFCSAESTSSITQQECQRVMSYTLMPFFSVKVAFSNLETLKLSSLNLDKVWDDNQHSVHKLANLIVDNCVGLRCLFSSTMVGSFLNLKRLEISKCPTMEAIIATEETNNRDSSQEIRFSKLETIILKDMENLKTIWHCQFETLKTLEVENCAKIVVIFPSFMQRTYHNLETLVVTGCASVEEIFELTTNGMSSEESQLKDLILCGLPKLKQTWSRDPQEILDFCNLQNMHLKDCENLKYLFPLSVAMSCLNLKILIVNWCGVEEIVTRKEGSTCTTPTFEFNELNILELSGLHKLKRFYAGNHTLACPSLRKINVYRCGKFNLFERHVQATSSQGRTLDDKLHVSMEQPLFTIEQVIPKLEELTLNDKDASTVLQAQLPGKLFIKLKHLWLFDFKDKQAIPYWLLQNSPRLEQLVVGISSFNEIFSEEKLVGEEGQIEINTYLKGLWLSTLPELKHISKEGSQFERQLDILESIDVSDCSSLINLAPSSATFSHLTSLVISECNGMINLITSPTARSLVKLAYMEITMCNLLEEIMTDKLDAPKTDIGFSCLEILQLECLPRLTRFCSSKYSLRFPVLKKVVVRQCPRMKILSDGKISTPKLRKVQIEENDEEWHWKGNLNSTIKGMFDDKVAFRSFKHLTLSEYPELKDLWYGQLPHNVFSNLKSLVVQRCDFLSDVLFSSNLLQVLHGLEELEVRDCDSLKTVFDVKGMESKEMLANQITKLKKLTLSGLRELKHIWSKDPQEIMSFGNLCMVSVVECQSLINLFPLLLCQDLVHLEELELRSSGVEEIVAMDEESTEYIFNFPRLTKLRLVHLTNLKSFYQGRHTLECLSLKILNVYRCEALQMLAFESSNFQQSGQLDEIHDMPIGKALFSIEKVSPHLEELALNGKDAMRILNGNYRANLFHKVEILRLQCFDETPIVFLKDFLEIFPSLVTLQVRNSSFETLFHGEGIYHSSTRNPNKMRGLWLFELDQLENIWQENSPLDQLAVQNLEELRVRNCPSLLSIVPSSISLKNLTIMMVDDCKLLTYVISSLVAKSLMQLTTLKIKNCEMIEDVVKIDDEEAEEGIIFENLVYLKLTSLCHLRSFCFEKRNFIFPSLVRFVFKGCPNMKTFSSGVTIAPLLTSVEVENKKHRWMEDLSTTVEQLFRDKEVSQPNDEN